jgi:hypothetical protein
VCVCVCVCVFGNLDVGCAGLLLGSFFRIWDRRELFCVLCIRGAFCPGGKREAESPMLLLPWRERLALASQRV